MSLALAGAISGMGQGLERGLQQLQGGLIQHGLQESDRKFQTEKLQLQMAHAEKLATAQQDLTREESRLTREAHSKDVDKRIAFERETEGWRSMVEGGKHADLTRMKERELELTKDKLDQEKQAEIDKGAYYKAYAGYLNRRTPEQISEKDKEKIRFYNNRLSALENTRKGLLSEKVKQDKDVMGLNPEKEAERQAKIEAALVEINKEISAVSRQGMELIGIAPPAAPLDKTETGPPDDSFAYPKSKGKTPPPAPTGSPQSSVAPTTVYPNQKQPHGPQGLVNRLWNEITK